MGTDTDCIFCKIVAGEIPSTKVTEDDDTYVFMDINPATQGHALVIPKRHTQDITTIDPADLTAVMTKAQQIATRAKEVFAADGVNLLQCSGAAAFQTVFHVHLHVIPRYAGDPERDRLGQQWTPVSVPGDPDRIAELAERLAP